MIPKKNPHVMLSGDETWKESEHKKSGNKKRGSIASIFLACRKPYPIIFFLNNNGESLSCIEFDFNVYIIKVYAM